MITLIRGGWVVAFDGTRHQVIPGGEVAIEQDRVIYAGPKFPGAADRVVAKDSWLVSPGFINLHGHIGLDVVQPLVDAKYRKRFGPSKEFISGSSSLVFFEHSLTPREQRLAAEFSLVQMMKCGSTTVVDASGSGTTWWLNNAPQAEEMLVDIAGRLGSRVYLSSSSVRSGRSYVNPDGSRGYLWDDEKGMAALERAVRFALTYAGSYNGLVQGLLCPISPYDCSTDLLLAAKAAAAENGLPIQIHTGTVTYRLKWFEEREGTTPVEHLHNIGFLGPEVILGHCLYITGHPAVGGEPDRELGLIADSGASVAHSPLPFARSGVALYTLPRYLDAGVNVGIGCDIWPVDMISEMRLAWFVGKIVSKDSTRPAVHEVFDCATLRGAQALQRDDLGRLAPGSKADIVCVDLGRYHIGPVLDPIRALLTCAKGQDVETVFINGREVIAGGRVLGANEDQLKAAAPGILEKLYAVASARTPGHITAREILEGG